jgi:hypothetical protein
VHGHDIAIRHLGLPRPLRRGPGRRRPAGYRRLLRLPALVVGDANTIPVTEAAQVEAAFAGAADAYRAQGLVGIRPELRAVDPLTATLTLVDVAWSYLDEAGAARQHTSYRYLLRRSDTDRLGIQMVVDTTPQP